ncbi:MAG TPA: SGNH/GDSL hydrolase family protein, partial [Capillimicrobium sp.]
MSIAGCALAGLLAPAGAAAAPGSGPTAVVSLGDSFISGEAGRWQGNSVSPLRDRDGTDRAWRSGDLLRPSGRDAVYPGGTDADGCHRSDVAPVHAARALGAPFQASVNLACSGAETADIVDAEQKGYPPQAAQLAGVAASHDVKMVVLSIGGNDLGFASIIQNCIIKFASGGTILPTPCHPTEQPKVDAAMPAAAAGVGRSIDAVRATMAAAGYAPGDYRLVLQSYPSPVPRAADVRYAVGALRLTPGSCPFTNADADWARDALVNQIADMLSGVAAERNVEFLDLRSLFDGHEACAKGSRQAGPLAPPTGATMEWARFIDLGQYGGETQESFHPNAYGQQAMGACWAALAGSAPGRFACGNVAGAGPERVVLGRTGELRAPEPAPVAPAPAPVSPAQSAPAPVVPPTASKSESSVGGGGKAATARAKRALARSLARCGRIERAGKRKACK